jgi:two-component system nitrate/nitrite sensor histidine kinase NarX
MINSPDLHMSMMVAEKDNQFYKTRRGQLSAYGRAWASARTLQAIFIALGVLLLGLLLLLWFNLSHSASSKNTHVDLIMALLFVATLGSLLLVYHFTKRHFIEPDLAFRKWLQQVCDGDLSARIGLPEQHEHYNELNFHTRNLTVALRDLSTDMDSLVGMQTNRLEQQKAELKLLFDLTTAVSRESELQTVAHTVCPALANWFDDVQVSLFKIDNNEYRFLNSACSESATTRFNSPDAIVEKVTAHVNQQFGKSLYFFEALPETTPSDYTVESKSGRPNVEGYAQIAFMDGDIEAGLLIVESNDLTELKQDKAKRILSTVAQQLTLFVSKYSAAERGQQTRLYQQRSEMAAEIHDSLAQTLLATRYQIAMLRDTVKKQTPEDLLGSIEKLDSTIGEANSELRGLIHEYRSQLGANRSTDSLQELIESFREKSDSRVFFQQEDSLLQFTPREAPIVQNIVAEVLNNAQKYAQASMIRVYLRLRPSGVRVLLIEDDGIGFDYEKLKALSDDRKEDFGNHIGLSIMQERALSIGAVLDIESEIEEGTRITLTLPPLSESQAL